MTITYVLTTWEALELLEEILKQHFEEEKINQIPYKKKQALKVLEELNLPNNYSSIIKYSNPDVAKEISVKWTAKLFPPQESKPEKVNKPQESKGGKFARLIYAIAQEVEKHLDCNLNVNQLSTLLAYVGRDRDIGKYLHKVQFDPKYNFRNSLKGSTWMVYTWDYGLQGDSTKVSGLRRSVLKFTNLFRVELSTFRNREKKRKTYTGDYIITNDNNYIKIRFRTSFESTTREFDLIFFFWVDRTDDENNLALGQYNSIDSGSLQAGTAIMQRLEDHEVDQADTDFTTNPQEWEIDQLIIDYLKDKTNNYLKLPEKKITSIGSLKEWSISQKKPS